MDSNNLISLNCKKTTKIRESNPQNYYKAKRIFSSTDIKEVFKGKKVTEVAIKYRIGRTSIYRWQKRYDGTVESLYEKSQRPHRHPNSTRKKK